MVYCLGWGKIGASSVNTLLTGSVNFSGCWHVRCLPLTQEVLGHIKAAQQTLNLMVSRLAPVAPVTEYLDRVASADEITRVEEDIFNSPRDERSYEISSRLEFEGLMESGSDGTASTEPVPDPPRTNRTSATELPDVSRQAGPTLDIPATTSSGDDSDAAAAMEQRAQDTALAQPATLSGVSQSILDSNYVKTLRERMISFEAELQARDEKISCVESERDCAVAELKAVLEDGDVVTQVASPTPPSAAFLTGAGQEPTASGGEETLQSLGKTLQRNIEATRNVATPLTQLMRELPRRIASVVTSNIELQNAAAEQAKLSQEINPEMLSGAEQLILSRCSSRVGEASDAADLNDKALEATVTQMQCNVEMLQKTARLAEHHAAKLTALLRELPELGKTLITPPSKAHPALAVEGGGKGWL